MKRKTIIGLSALAGVAIAVFAAPWRTSAVGPQSSCFRVPRYDTTGVWTFRRVADGMLSYQVISPEVNGRSTSIIGIPNMDPTFFGMFPDVTTMTDYVGHRVRTGPNSWDATWIEYGCAAPDQPGLYGEVVWIGIMRAA
ncbi:MAG: hypothetical protein Q8Q12_11125 [bacterium]|nr:hypothetical protein [bacterium]